VTHDRAELVRHRSSYVFWKNIIDADGARGASILDLGCGVGRGCVALAKLRGSRVVGVDSSAESLAYAEANYGRRNVHYVQEDMGDFIANMPDFDYVVSRGAIEHVPEGLALLRHARWRRRLLFDVPYDEPAGNNPHHVLHGLREDAFAGWDDAELFFSRSRGLIYAERPERANMIMCIASAPGLTGVGSVCRFPVAAWG
jgi:SAM-dependent methyltransferase